MIKADNLDLCTNCLHNRMVIEREANHNRERNCHTVELFEANVINVSAMLITISLMGRLFFLCVCKVNG